MIYRGPVRCSTCGRYHHYDLGCSYCSDLLECFRQIKEKSAPSIPCRVRRLAAVFVAAMREGFRLESHRSRFTSAELKRAIDLAGTYMKGIGYILREEPEQLAGTVNSDSPDSQDTGEAKE